MDGFDPAASFGPAVAGSYDEHLRRDEGDAVGFLAELAQGGSALELAIGTATTRSVNSSRKTTCV